MILNLNKQEGILVQITFREKRGGMCHEPKGQQLIDILNEVHTKVHTKFHYHSREG